MTTTALAAVASGPALGHLLPIWSVAPFGLILLGIAVLPLVAGHFWERNRNKALVSAALGAAHRAVDRGIRPHRRAPHRPRVRRVHHPARRALRDRGRDRDARHAGGHARAQHRAPRASARCIASLVGTTGASMLLIRPLLRANSVRRRKVHVVVFFIFIVRNAGGLLTPLGDPPLFLGFLRGVPFLWTLRLWREWLFVNGALLALFYVVDSTIFRKEDLETPGDLDEVAVEAPGPGPRGGGAQLPVPGRRGGGAGRLRLARAPARRAGGGHAAHGRAVLGRPPRSRSAHENGFTWRPIVEVAVIFVGIFATMIPALAILNARGGELGAHASPGSSSGRAALLSSFLDNAPTYLTFASAASGLAGTDAGAPRASSSRTRAAPSCWRRSRSARCSWARTRTSGTARTSW